MQRQTETNKKTDTKTHTLEQQTMLLVGEKTGKGCGMDRTVVSRIKLLFLQEKVRERKQKGITEDTY